MEKLRKFIAPEGNKKIVKKTIRYSDNHLLHYRCICFSNLSNYIAQRLFSMHARGNLRL